MFRVRIACQPSAAAYSRVHASAVIEKWVVRFGVDPDIRQLELHRGNGSDSSTALDAGGAEDSGKAFAATPGSI